MAKRIMRRKPTRSRRTDHSSMEQRQSDAQAIHTSSRVRVSQRQILRTRASELDQTFSPTDLYGSMNQPGTLYRMRWEHPDIKTYMDAQVELVANCDYGWEPADDSVEAVTVALVFDEVFRDLHTGTLSSFVADTWDHVATYGSIIWHMSCTPHGKLRLDKIPPRQVQSWDLDEYGFDVVRFRLWSGADLDRDAPNWVWMGKKRTNDDYWGASVLRSLVDVYAVYMEDMSGYASERRTHKGILTIVPRDIENLTEEGYRTAEDWLSAFYQGQPYPAVLPAGFRPEYIKADSPSIAVVPDMVRMNQDAIARALNNNVMALSGGGSYAVGKEMEDVDRERRSRALGSLLDIVNGVHEEVSNLPRRLAQVLGLDPDMAPRLVVLDNSQVPVQERVDVITGLVDAGLVAPTEVADKTLVSIAEDAGIQLEEEE